MLDFDSMLMHVGEFGLYQKILCVFQAPFCMFVTFVLFGQLFMTLSPMNYWCEDHFKCIDNNSIATAAQRSNISFVWPGRDLFQSNPCLLNEITDNILKALSTWDKNQRDDKPCKVNRAMACEYPADPDYNNDNWYNPRQTQRPSPPPKLSLSEEASLVRRKRYYGNTPRPQNPTITTRKYAEYENGGDQYGGYGGYDNTQRPKNPTATTRKYTEYENGGDQYGGYGGYDNTQRPKNPTATTRKYTEYENGGDDEQYGGYDGGYGGNRYGSNTKRPKPGATQSPLQGSKGSRTSVGQFTNVSSAYAGWPVPSCPGNERFTFVLSNNTVILTDRMQVRFKNKKLEQIGRCSKIRYNRSEVPYETVATEGDWYCNADLYNVIATSVFYLGAIVGGFLIGWVADTFGRVPALVIANILGALGGALSVVSTNVWIFSVFRFITGMAFDNCFTMMYILVLEFCGPSYRTLVANLSIAIFYTIGTLLIPFLAWLIGDWRIYALVISLPMLLGLLALFFVPESARWLLSKGRAKEATNILRNFAKVNRRKVDEKVFVDFEHDATKLFAQLAQEEEEPGLVAAFKTPRLRRTFILLIIFWSLIALVYDGHSRNIINLANEDLSVFWMFGIASMTEFPADMMLIFTLDRFGRRWLAFGSLTLSAAFSFIAAAITQELRTAYITTAIISRFWVNVAFNIGLQYAAELLPTVIRAQGVNAIHIMGYVASIISPFVAAIGRSNPGLSLILLGIFSITAGFAALFLAETLGEELPNTLEEAEAFGKNQSFWNCPICAKEGDEYPIQPAAMEERPVVLRNALRGSIRGETYRSSMISHTASGGSRRSRYIHPGDQIVHSPQPTEMTKLRRITH